MHSVFHIFNLVKLSLDKAITVFIKKIDCLSVFDTLPDFKIYFDYKQNHLKLRTLYENIDEYIQNLKYINSKISEDKLLDSKIFKNTEVDIYVSDFLNSKKCVVISDLDEVYTEFYNEAILFLSNFYYLRELKELTANQEYNFMLIGKVYVNINLVIDYFSYNNEVSIKCGRKTNLPDYWMT